MPPSALVAVAIYPLKPYGTIVRQQRHAGQVHDSLPPGVVTFTPAANFVAYSPDGKYLAFAAANDGGLPRCVAPAERRSRGP